MAAIVEAGSHLSAFLTVGFSDIEIFPCFRRGGSQKAGLLNLMKLVSFYLGADSLVFSNASGRLTYHEPKSRPEQNGRAVGEERRAGHVVTLVEQILACHKDLCAVAQRARNQRMQLQLASMLVCGYDVD